MTEQERSPIALKLCRLENGLAGSVDEMISQFLGSLQNQDAAIGIDLSQVKFIEPASLIFILAIVNDRKAKNRRTILRPPKDYDVRNFLRTWRFFEALKAVTDPSSQYTSDVKSHDPKRRVLSRNDSMSQSDDSLESIVKREYLPIRVLCGTTPEDRPSNHHVDSELRRWNDTVIMAWLQSHLMGPQGIERDESRDLAKENFPARIVFEAMMNCVRHPEATRIATTSHIYWPKKSPEKGTYTAIWWDDGKGIVETLREAIDAGGPIISDAPPLPEKQCAVKMQDASQTRDNCTMLTTDFVPSHDSPDSDLLFSSICSRVTRDPEGKGHRTALSEDIPQDSPLRQPGMGLYILADCAINIFGGSVAFRTDEYFMNVKIGLKRGERKADYAVAIKCIDTGFEFPGNMLTVRLPITRKIAEAESRR